MHIWGDSILSTPCIQKMWPISYMYDKALYIMKWIIHVKSIKIHCKWPLSPDHYFRCFYLKGLMPIQFHVVKTNEKKMPKAYENKMTHSTLTHFGPKQASLIIMIILVYQSMMDNNRHLQRKCPQKQSFNQLISVDFLSKKEKQSHVL